MLLVLGVSLFFQSQYQSQNLKARFGHCMVVGYCFPLNLEELTSLSHLFQSPPIPVLSPTCSLLMVVGSWQWSSMVT